MLKILEKQKNQAAKRLNVFPYDLKFYAWPQAFGSTCGPFLGIGGQTVTSCTIYAYTDGKDAVLFCGSRIWKNIVDFDPRIAVMGGYK